jgi:hypothetical protein
MSDGITEAYRGNYEARRLDKAWTNFITEDALLGANKELHERVVSLSTDALIEEIRSKTEDLQILFDEGYYMRRNGQIDVKFFCEKIGFKSRKNSLRECLVEAMLYVEFCSTEEGKRLCKDAYDA